MCASSEVSDEKIACENPCGFAVSRAFDMRHFMHCRTG
jgi:hypothetical protein